MVTLAVLFDLDGTLLDTLTDLADAANRVIATHGFPVHPIEDYRWFVGDGSARLIERALPINHRSPAMIRTCLDAFIADYGANWNRKTAAYPGIMDLLAELQDRHIKLAIVTNKPHRFTEQMIVHYFPEVMFDPIFGQRDDIPKKPDPMQALAAAKHMQVEPQHCLFVGDSAVDIETAQRAGMTPVGASWGLRPVSELREAGAEVIIDHPLDLRSIIADGR